MGEGVMSNNGLTPEQLARAWEAGCITPLAAPQDATALQAALGGAAAAGLLAVLAERHGPGVIVGSGGSAGGRRWCLQPLAHLQASAAATAHWLGEQGLDPAACVHLNPLPLHHVSGLLPPVRCRQWGAAHRRLEPAWMRDPAGLAAAVPVGALAQEHALLLSLVPTQLARLLEHPAGVAWLQQLAVIWVGGAPLPQALATRARQLGLRLAPCYGATETAAMVCALPPARFLAGDDGCGPLLIDVHLHIDPNTEALELTTPRLSPGTLEQGRLRPLPRTAAGGWRSGDAAQLGPAGVRILGRLDGAIHSGGETVFPEQVEQALRAMSHAAGLPLAEVLLLAEPCPEWGERLVALVRPLDGAAEEPLLKALVRLAKPLPPSQRPRRWLLCPGLQRSPLGKWQRSRWQAWLQDLPASSG